LFSSVGGYDGRHIPLGRTTDQVSQGIRAADRSWSLLFAEGSGGGFAVVDGDDLASQEGRFGGAEEEDRLGEFLGDADALDWDARDLRSGCRSSGCDVLGEGDGGGAAEAGQRTGDQDDPV
jgi:hypothetical protein